MNSETTVNINKTYAFIHIQRIISFLIVVANIIAPIIIMNSRPTPSLLDSEMYYEYNADTGFSTCELTLIFDISVSDGHATIYFYDKNNKNTDVVTNYFYSGNSRIVKDTIYSVKGEICRYYICDMEFNLPFSFADCAYALWFLLSLTLTYFICAIHLNCKEYKYNDNLIIVYAGLYNHFILIDEVKYDEHKTFSSFVPIYLSCTLPSGDIADVTISTSNKIALKINNKLVPYE